jgi:hypothetical protein
MMFDLPTRLVVAYGLIALLVLAAVAMVWWLRHNSPHHRDQRQKARDVARYRLREQAAAEAPGEGGTRS